MIDNGFPLTTEPNILREMIAPPNIVNKVLSVVTGNTSNVSNILPGATASCVPWRTTGLKHASNEVYVDLVEEMDAIINRHAQTLLQLNLSSIYFVSLYIDLYRDIVYRRCHAIYWIPLLLQSAIVFLWKMNIKFS